MRETCSLHEKRPSLLTSYLNVDDSMSNKYVERTDLARVNQTGSGEVEFLQSPPYLRAQNTHLKHTARPHSRVRADLFIFEIRMLFLNFAYFLLLAYLIDHMTYLLFCILLTR